MFHFISRETRRNFHTVILPAVVLVLLAAGALQLISGGSEQKPASPPPGVPLSMLRQHRSGVFYLGTLHTAPAYRRIKTSEARQLRTAVQQKFGIPFRVRTTRYFNLAYRCPAAEINRLSRYLERFFADIYPRFFRYEPAAPFTVVYFQTAAEFTRHTGSRAYGFFRPSERTMYTWAGSGHGTLWHEMIHAFVHDNTDSFVPQWFSEGFASFYEMAFLINGRVSEGYSNWRMPQLHRAIRRNQVPPLQQFMRRDRMQIDFGYAYARFLFCYLWQHRIMVPFVRGCLYSIFPRYSGEARFRETVKLLEKLRGKRLAVINRELIRLAAATPKNRKLSR